jgi:hypothetical protein
VSSSLLSPAYSLTIGSKRWTEQVVRLEVRLDAAPLVDVVTARFPAAAPVDAATGDPVILRLDGGEGATDVFTGSVTSIRRDGRTTTVSAVDAGGILAAFRPATTFEQATVGTVIGDLCADAGVDTGSIEDGPTLAFYAADPGRTALEHVARLAGWAGALASVNAAGELGAQVVTGTDPDVALRYGRDVLELEAIERSAPVDSFVVAGEAGAGDAGQPEALRPASDFFGGSRPDGPSRTSVWAYEPALRTAATARTASASLTRLYTSGRKRALLHGLLQPMLRPGTVLQVQDVPDGLPGGPFWLDRVSHTLGPAGATTRARLWTGGDAFDPAGLLGSLAGAVGGLL